MLLLLYDYYYFEMEELQAIGYKGVAYGFLKDDVVTAYTTDCAACAENEVVDVIRSVVLLG